jgi:hypothetical protein
MTGAPFGMSLLSYSQIASFSYIFYKEYQLDRKIAEKAISLT